MNVLLLPSEDDAANAAVIADIVAMKCRPVLLNDAPAVGAVVLVYGADHFAHLTAGIFLGRNYPVCFFAPGKQVRPGDGAPMFHPRSRTAFRGWLGDAFLRGVACVPEVPGATKKGDRT